MTTTKCILMVTAFLAGTASAATAIANSFLDPRADITVEEPLSQKSSNNGGTLHVKEGALVRIYCRDRIFLDRPWHKDNPGWVSGPDTGWRFQSMLRINGALVEIFQTQIPSNTKLGHAFGPKTAYYIDFDQPVVYWVAKGIGNHEVHCIMDTKTELPDKNRGNNVALALIKVSPSKPVAKAPAQPPAQPMADDATVQPMIPYVPATRPARPRQDASRGAPPPDSGTQSTGSPHQPAATRATVAPTVSSAQDASARAMEAADCVLEQARSPGHYACPTQAGVDRCERLRAAGDVNGCRLVVGR